MVHVSKSDHTHLSKIHKEFRRGPSRKSPAGSTRLKPNQNFFNSPSQSDGVGKEGSVPESLLKQAGKTGSLNLSNR